MLSAGAAVLSAAAAVLSLAQQAFAESLAQQDAAASVFSVLALLPEQATSIAATAAIANRFFIIVYLINVVLYHPCENDAKLIFRLTNWPYGPIIFS